MLDQEHAPLLPTVVRNTFTTLQVLNRFQAKPALVGTCLPLSPIMLALSYNPWANGRLHGAAKPTARVCCLIKKHRRLRD